MTLKHIYEYNKDYYGFVSDKGTIHSYIEVYEEILAPYQKTAHDVIEIGIFQGNSLRMWEKYFSCRVWGVDCDIKPHGGMADLSEMIKTDKHLIEIFDACNAELVNNKFKDRKFDVIIEDAGHAVEQQVELYNIWKNYLSPNGIYIIEDVQDIDNTRGIFKNLDNEKNITIFDRRNLKNRYDDVLVVINNLNTKICTPKIKKKNT